MGPAYYRHEDTCQPFRDVFGDLIIATPTPDEAHTHPYALSDGHLYQPIAWCPFCGWRLVRPTRSSREEEISLTDLHHRKLVDDPVELADRLLSEARWADPLQPVPIIALCHRHGLDVINTTFTRSDVSGALMGREGTFTIYVNQATLATRQRLTIAHALGHYVLHFFGRADRQNMSLVDDDSTVGFRHWPAMPPEERRANAFAATLLIPALTASLYPTLSIATLAFLLAVSRDTMAFRIRDMAHQAIGR